jgi:hypothetical protein
VPVGARSDSLKRKDHQRKIVKNIITHIEVRAVISNIPPATPSHVSVIDVAIPDSPTSEVRPVGVSSRLDSVHASTLDPDLCALWYARTAARPRGPTSPGPVTPPDHITRPQECHRRTWDGIACATLSTRVSPSRLWTLSLSLSSTLRIANEEGAIGQQGLVAVAPSHRDGVVAHRHKVERVEVGRKVVRVV